MRKIGAIIGIIFGIIYIINPTAGVMELIPDNLPIIGNFDEVGAVLLILKCLNEFGINFISKKSIKKL